jgi:hypothetical protein
MYYYHRILQQQVLVAEAFRALAEYRAQEASHSYPVQHQLHLLEVLRVQVVLRVLVQVVLRVLVQVELGRHRLEFHRFDLQV